MSFNRFLEKTITKSQRCQRNWNLSKEIPIEDIKTLKTSVTQCSSKQNRVFYKCKFITNRNLIEKIYKKTIKAGYIPDNSWYTLNELGLTHEEATKQGYTRQQKHYNLWGKPIYDDTDMSTNPQVLGNLLVAFIADRDPSEGYRVRSERQNGIHLSRDYQSLETKRDADVALGIATGYLTLTANMLGYSSGCCQCHDEMEISELLGETSPTLLLMGIGYPDTERSRLLHHVSDKKFPSRNKQILVEDVI